MVPADFSVDNPKLLMQPRFIAELQYLREHLRQNRQVLPAEPGYAVVIRMLVRAKIAKGYVVVTGTFDPPRTRHPNAIAIQQHPNHHHRVIRCFPSPIAPSVIAVDLRQLQTTHQFRDEAGQVIFRQPVLQ